jgi:hypothetical protein
MVLPSGRTSRVRSIVTYDGELEHAFPPMSVTVCLEDEIDISRGDMLVPPSHPPHVSRQIDARIVWMQEQPLEIGRNYLLRHTTQVVRAAVRTVRYRIDINTLEKETSSVLQMNDMGAVVIESHKPVFCDPYRRNRATGSFILLDPMTNATVAAGMITGREPVVRAGSNLGSEKFSVEGDRISALEQQSQAGHRPLTLWMETTADVAYHVERMLFDSGCRVHAISPSEAGNYLPEVSRALNDAGVIAIVVEPDAAIRERVREKVGNHNFLPVEPSSANENREEMADRIYRLLEQQGFVSKSSQRE